MGFNILIAGITNPRSTTVLAHHLAQDPGISLQQARLMLTQLPVLYHKNLSKQEVARVVPKLRAMGVAVRLEESEIDPAPVPTTVPPAKEAEPAPPPAETAQPTPEPYHRRTASAGRQLSVDAAVTPQRKKNGRMRKTVIGSVTAGAILLLIVLLSRMDSGKEFSVHKMGPMRIEKKRSAARGHRTGSAGQQKPRGRAAVTGEQKQEALALIDSAAVSRYDLTRAIKFYRMALSFNQYNVHAWYGLIAAYTEAGMLKEAAETHRKMKETLGDRSFTVADLVEPFGAVNDIIETGDGVLRIEYRTRNEGKMALLKETFRIAAAVSESCGCNAISMFATTAPGSGLLVHIPTKNFPPTLSVFQKKAAVTYLE